MATGTGVTALLADVARVGPYFAIATGPAPGGGGWVPLEALTGPAGRVDDPLRVRIAAVVEALGCDERVAASTAFQGLAAQLVAPFFAAAVLHGALPATATCDHEALSEGPATATCDHEALSEGPATATCDHEANRGLAGALQWRPGGSGPWLWWPGSGGRVVPCGDTALVDVLSGLLTPLVEAVRARVSISERVLWGDVASAVASARRLVTAARPDAADRATAVAERLLGAPPLAVTSSLRPPEPPDAGWTFRRRTCCLYYRVPGGGVCGDCVLHDRAEGLSDASPRIARSVAPPSPAL